MSRAINLSLGEAEVLSKCNEAGVGVSVTEKLPSGGTRLVCTTGDGAAEMRRKFKNDIIAGKEKRFPFVRMPSAW